MNKCPDLDSRIYGLSTPDLDWCIHQFRTRPDGREVQNLMFIEEKRNGEGMGFGERDTLCSVYQFFSGPRGKPISRRVFSRANRGFVRLRFYGLHKLAFSGNGPIDSERIEWDDQLISTADLILILRYEMSPITLRCRDERSHHGGAKQQMLPLVG